MALTARIPARRVAVGVGLAFSTVYVLLAGAQVPAVRTLLMLAVAAVGVMVARPGTAGVVWLWALAAVLAWDPWAGLTPGFWLSFGAVGVLLYAGTGRLSSPPPASRVARVLRALRAAARTQAVVTVALVPGTLALFQQVSLVSPIANALAIPVVTFAVVPMALAAIVAADRRALAGSARGVRRADDSRSMRLRRRLRRRGSSMRRRVGRWRSRSSASPGSPRRAACRGASSASSRCCRCSSFGPRRPHRARSRMTVLDVGQGLAVVVADPSPRAGLRHRPALHRRGRRGRAHRRPVPARAGASGSLGGMIVTHQDSDHSGGALTLLQTVPVDWLASSLPAEHAILARQAAGGGAVLRCEAGQRWTWDGVRFAVLQPTAAHYAAPPGKPNDLSCVVRIESDYGSALLTGDLEARGELELVRRDPSALKADVLLVPHHGSRTSSTPAFIAAVAPEIAVYTPGYRNRFGHPRPDVVARYDRAGVRGYRTDHDGALTFTFAPGSPRAPRAERAHDRRYWRDAPVRGEATPLE